MSTEQELIAKVHNAASYLENKHFDWIVNAALDHFNKEIKDLELSIIRHQIFKDEVYYAYQTLDTTREEEIERAHHFIEEYGKVVNFLRALSNLLRDHSARQFAREILQWKKTTKKKDL